VKESDRIAALVDGLARMGAAVEERPTALDPGRPPPARRLVASHDDHRIAMALAVRARGRGRDRAQGAECVAVSFPDFFDLVARATAV
jgi:3-phosphoshikimate 1-carboxyvinyltransferase